MGKKLFHILLKVFILGFTFFVFPSLFYFVVFAMIIISKVSKGTKKMSDEDTLKTNSSQISEETIFTCKHCGMILSSQNKFCIRCGVPCTAENMIVTKTQPIVILDPSQFNPIYQYTEDKMLETIIVQEMAKAGIDPNTNLIPSNLIKRKKILNLIFFGMIFVWICLIFFHFPILTYLIGMILLIIAYCIRRKYSLNLINYIKREMKARSSEKISNIIMSIKLSLVPDTSKKFQYLYLLVAITLPFIIFMKPRIFYEKMENGYGVRFYTFGVTDFQEAVIPDNYHGKPVVSLRGNAFSNMPFLKKVTLPDTITEIRGQAFKNDIQLVEVNIPTNLTYLGGGAFENCVSLVEISLPDTLTYMGGETFKNATSLTHIKLSNNLTEIRGNTFENCKSLERIVIPDKIQRIGGHAFYGNRYLTSVTFTENSQLAEIGSSAFRKCNHLYSITIPKSTYVNERAFKESPTGVKRFGDIDLEHTINGITYTWRTLIGLKSVGDTQIVNPNIKDAIIKNTSITLVDVQQVNGTYQYALEYKDESGVISFTLDKDHSYKEINENLIFSIGNKNSYHSYYGHFTVFGYYN